MYDVESETPISEIFREIQQYLFFFEKMKYRRNKRRKMHKVAVLLCVHLSREENIKITENKVSSACEIFKKK